MTVPIHVNSGHANLVVERFGQGPPLIFAHGLTANRHVSRRQLTLLRDRFQIIVFDQRGHGDSTPVEDPSLYAVEEMAEDIGAVMDALEIDRAIVGGESMGAATALTFAVREANRAEALLLTAPAFGDAPNSEVLRFDAIAAAIESTSTEEFLAVAQNTWRNDLGWPPEAIELVSVMFRSHRVRSLVTAIRSVIRWLPCANLTTVQQITCPSCILFWQNDPLHPADLALRLGQELPNCTLFEMAPPPAIFVNPEQIADLYGRFLEEDVLSSNANSRPTEI